MRARHSASDANVDNNCAFSGPGPEPARLQFQPVAMLARHHPRQAFEREADIKR